MINVPVMLKIYLSCLLFALLLGSCNASPKVDCEGDPANKSAGQAGGDPSKKSDGLPPLYSHDIPVLITPIEIGRNVQQLSPYVMSSYAFHSLNSADHFEASIFAADQEEMIYDGDKLVVAVMFVSTGNLQEEPIAFYIYGKLDPGQLGKLDFCVSKSAGGDVLTIYSSSVCDQKTAPESDVILLVYDPYDNSVLIDNTERYQFR